VVNIGVILTLQRVRDQDEKLRSKLIDRQNGELFIDYPTSEQTGKTVYLENGAELLVTFVNESQKVYCFKTKVIGKRKENIPMIVLKEPPPDGYKQIQRRQFVRIEASIDAAIHPINREFPPFTTITDDISGGGISIVLPKQHALHSGFDVQVWLVLPFQDGSIDYLTVNAQVVRLSEENDRQVQKASLKFLDIDDKSQQKLMRFCFETQLQQKKKGIFE
jgi:c-di-GMP-binding flagellar brake protein YcgR